MANIPQILLAAGASSRMGSPKSLLKWGDENLIQFQVKKLLATQQSVCVVLGSQVTEVLSTIKNFPVLIVENPNWEQGMGSSIAAGVGEVNTRISDFDAVLISTIDQPLVSSEHLKMLIRAYKKDTRQIIVSESNDGWQGVPVLFDKFYIDELKALGGDNGARPIVKKYQVNVQSIQAGNQLVDMDTQAMYQKLLQNINHQF